MIPTTSASGRLVLYSTLLLIVIFCLRTTSCHKDPVQAEETEEDGIENSNAEKLPFRMNKINLVWMKAKQKLNATELSQFYAELVVQDRLELDLKKRTAEHGDEDGLQQAAVRKKFLNILRQFRLDDLYELTGTKQPHSDDDRLDSAIRNNEKLLRLWESAESAGFSDTELDALRTEFQHHMQKVEEYEHLRQDISRLEAMSENSIERRKDGSSLKSKHSELKKLYRDVMKSYQNLDQQAASSSTGGDGLSNDLLDDPRIKELWLMAVKTNLSESELISFREELGHFQKRISKHEYYAKEVELARHRRQREDGSSATDLRDMEAKAQDYGAKVKKWYTELKSRLLKTQLQHKEL